MRYLSTEIKGYNKPAKLIVFDSPEDFADFHAREVKPKWDDSYSLPWGGGASAKCREVLIEGNTANLDKAQAVMDKLDVSDLLTNSMPLLDCAIQGFVPNVSAYIAGQPEAMFNMVEAEQPNVTAPIRVFIETTVSSGVTHAQLVSRGIATLAFVLAMNTVRPVELYTISAVMDNRCSMTCGYAVRVNSAPMDLARAVWMLTSPGFARALMFSTCSYLGNAMFTGGPWPFDSDPTRENYEARMRDAFEINPEDVFIKGGHLYNSEMLTDPIAWVNKMVRKHSGQEVTA